MSSYESLPRSAPEDAIPERVEQLTVANTPSATEQHSTERKMNFDDSKLESAEISALSQDQDIDSGYASSNHLPYSNLPPQLPPRPQVTAESDACMRPCELPSESVDIDELSSSESNPYLECFP